METKTIFELKEKITTLSQEVEVLSTLGVEGMFLGELSDQLRNLNTKSKDLAISLLQLEKAQDLEDSNSKLKDFEGEY